MPEEIVPTEESQKEEPQETKEEILKPVEEKKEKRWLKPLLFSILGIVLAIGLVFAGYNLGQTKISPKPNETPLPTVSPGAIPKTGAYRVPGMDFTIDKALRVERKGVDKDLLVLTVTFAANEECPLTGGAVCGYDTRWFRLVDDGGFVQDMLFSYPTIKYLTTNPISQRILKLGEKDKGDIFFDIPKDKNKFYLTYSSTGETTEKILIEPELFDPTANWKTYTAGILFLKYPPTWFVKETTSGFFVFLPEESMSPQSAPISLDTRLEKEYTQSLLEHEEGIEDLVVEDISIAGKPATKISGRLGPGFGEETPVVAIVINHQNKAVVFEFSGEEETYQQIFNLMLSTFKFLE